MALNNVMEYACEIGALTQKYHVIGSETLGEGRANATSTDVTAVQSATSSAVDEANEMLKLRSPRARRFPAEHLQQQTAAVGHQLLVASVLPSHRISETGLNSPSLAAEDALKIAVDVATGAKKPSDYPKESFTKAVGIGCDNIDEYYDPNSIF